MTWKSMLMPYLFWKDDTSFFWPACSVGLLDQVARLTEPAAWAGDVPTRAPVTMLYDVMSTVAITTLTRNRSPLMCSPPSALWRVTQCVAVRDALSLHSFSLQSPPCVLSVVSTFHLAGMHQRAW